MTDNGSRVLSVYALDTGLFTGEIIGGPDYWVESQIPAGFGAVDGAWDYLSHRVDLTTGQVVDYQPPQPPDDQWQTWAWDADSRRWVATPTTAAYWQGVRNERNRRLTDSDWIVSRSTESGVPVPAEWVAYRQALRDITDQPDPLNITWPAPPAA